MRRTAVLMAATLLSACADQPTIPPDITVQVMEPVVWAGTDWVLRSPGFAQLATPLTITLDDSVVTATVVDYSTITVRAPATGGVYQLQIRTGTQILSGQVEVAGFLGMRTTIALGGWPLPLAPGSPTMIAAAESGLVRVNLATGIASPMGIPNSVDCLLLAPGQTYRADVIVAGAKTATGCDYARGWLLAPLPTALDSGPGGGYMTLQLGPTTWLRAGPHFYEIFRNGVKDPWVWLEESERAFFSPDRALVALTADGGYRPPVLDVPTATVRYEIPMAPVGGMAFTPAGDTLFMFGGTHGGPTPGRLVALASATGQVLSDVQAPPGYFADLVLDPRGRWIYLTEYGGPTVVVVDRQTLLAVATLDAPCPDDPWGCGGQVGTGIDAASLHLYVLGARQWDWFFPGGSAPSPISDFSLPPVAQSPLTLEP